MSQKELNYIEDIYNHEKSLVEILKYTIDILDDDNYIELFTDQIEKHNTMLENIECMLGEEK